MKTRKQIISLIAAVTTLSAITGASAFAASLNSEDKQVKEQPPVVAEEAAEADEAAETEEAADETAAAEDETEATEAAEDAAEETVTEAVADEDLGEEVTVVAEDGTKPEPPAEAEGVKPPKHIGKREMAEMIANVFDTEAMDFKDDEAKTAWFEFIELYLTEPAAPQPGEGPAPIEIVKPEDGTKPEPPAGPAEDGTKPEPPVGPIAPPVAPAEDGTKPQPPVGPAAHSHVAPGETTTETTTVAEAE